MFLYFVSANLFLAAIFLKEKIRPENLFGECLFFYW